MGMIRRLADGLTSALTGMGRTSDPRTANRYVYAPKTREDINAAYRGSGIMRKIVNAPADDMIREWREWKADVRRRGSAGEPASTAQHKQRTSSAHLFMLSHTRLRDAYFVERERREAVGRCRSGGGSRFCWRPCGSRRLAAF